MSSLHFVHGSKAAPDKPEDFRFRLFNYLYDPNGIHQDYYVSSGLDAEGPGIYAFSRDENGFTPERIKNAQDYTPMLQGSVIGFHIDLTDEEGERIVPANEHPADEVDAEYWVEVINTFIQRLHALKGYDEDLIEEAIEHVADVWQTHADNGYDMEHPDLIEATQQLEHAIGGGFTIRECPPSDYDNVDEWRDAMRDSSAMYDPASHIHDNGGVESVVSYAMMASDDLWGVVKNLHNTIAVSATGKGYQSYNLEFYEAVKRVIPDMSLLRYANVNNGGFQVVFDVDAIQVDYMVIHRTLMPAETQQTLLLAVDEYRKNHHMLEENQIALGIVDIGRQLTGKTAPHDLALSIARRHIHDPMDPHLASQLISELSAKNIHRWERNPGISEKYQIDPNMSPGPKAASPKIGNRHPI